MKTNRIPDYRIRQDDIVCFSEIPKADFNLNNTVKRLSLVKLYKAQYS